MGEKRVGKKKKKDKMERGREKNRTELKAESREERKAVVGGSCKVMRRGRLSRGVELINE